MPKDRLRRQVAFEAARLLVARDESQYHRAKRKAARRVYGGDFHERDLPTDRQVRQQVLQFARADHRELYRENLGRLPGDHRPVAKTPDAPGNGGDRFHVYQMLLWPLEKIKEDRRSHPEGDVLYHSLQVFTLAREHLPYDEEFLLAALLHDVGKAIDPREHVAAGLEALRGAITPRTAWLIEHHGEALLLIEGTLGVRSRRRLQAAESFDELMLLARCDREGRRTGVRTPDVEDALDYLRKLAESCGE
jgi:predicted HD phosphohydrolase